MENKKFDDFIKQSLEHLDGEKYIPMDWSSMNEQLDTNGLDETLKGSLENLDGAAFVPMDWDMMESKLDAAMADSNADAEIDPQLEDIYLDAIAYDHLKNMQPAYNHEHWEMMSARLDEEYAYRRKVFVTKLFEAAIVLLLVWTAFNYFPHKKSTPEARPIAKINPTQNNTNDHSTDLTEQSILEDQSVPTFENTIPSEEIIQNEIIEEVVNQKPTSTPTSKSNPVDEITFIPFPPISNDKISESPFLENANSISLLENKKQKTTSLPLEKTIVLNEKDFLKGEASKEDILKEKLIVQISPLPSLMSSFLELNGSSDDRFSLDQINGKKRLRTHEVFFSMYGSGDLNFVDSDFYNENKREQDVYQRYRKGYGGGFALGFQLNKILIETGISYNFVSYQQREEARIIGSFARGYIEETWDDAELNMVQIPLNLQHSFFVHKKWRMYTLTGVSINMALQNNFNFQLEDQQERTPTASRSSLINESEIATEASLYKGIFEGGGFRENSYLTANLGFGLERKFTYRWSLFLQPIYRRHFMIDGLGPNEDRIHSSSIRFGAKVKIR